MKYTDEIIKNLSINNFDDLSEEDIDLEELAQLYDPVIKIFDTEHPVKNYIESMPQDMNIAKFISEYEHGVDKFEEWIIDTTKLVASTLSQALSNELSTEKELDSLAELFDSGDINKFLSDTELSSTQTKAFQQVWNMMTEGKAPCEVPIMLAVACITKNLHNSAKVHLLNYAEDIWFSGTNLRENLKQAKAISSSNAAIKNEKSKMGRARWKVKDELEKRACDLRYSDSYITLKDLNAAKKLVTIVRDINQDIGYPLSFDDMQVVETLRGWFRKNRLKYLSNKED